MQVTQVTLLVVGLIVGFALGLLAGWYFWRGSSPVEEEAPERSERRPARYPRSYEPSTPPQHRPSPRPRPVTALHHPNPISASVDEVRRPEPSFSPLRDAAPPPAAASAPPAAPAPELRFPPARPVTPDPEPVARHDDRPASEPEGPVSIGEPQAADRHLLNDLMETNRRLTADAERRLRREGAPAAEPVDAARRQPDRPAAPAPADNDLLARHRKLEEDSRRMSGRTD